MALNRGNLGLTQAVQAGQTSAVYTVGSGQTAYIKGILLHNLSDSGIQNTKIYVVPNAGSANTTTQVARLGIGTFENTLIATGTNHDIAGAIALDHLTVSGIATISSNLDVNGVNHDINGAIALDHLTVSGIATISSNLDVNGVNHDINGSIALDNVTVSAGTTIGGTLDVNGTNHDINGAIALDHVTVSGIVTANSFSGDGSNLSNLNIPAVFDWRDSSLF